MLHVLNPSFLTRCCSDFKLSIRRVSRIGSYGVIALTLSFGLRFAAINELANSLSSTTDEYDQAVSHISAVFIALVAAGAASRAAMGIAWYIDRKSTRLNSSH